MAQSDTARLPHGQVFTQKWPVLTYGETPKVDLGSWTFGCRPTASQAVATR